MKPKLNIVLMIVGAALMALLLVTTGRHGFTPVAGPAPKGSEGYIFMMGLCGIALLGWSVWLGWRPGGAGDDT